MKTPNKPNVSQPSTPKQKRATDRTHVAVLSSLRALMREGRQERRARGARS